MLAIDARWYIFLPPLTGMVGWFKFMADFSCSVYPGCQAKKRTAFSAVLFFGVLGVSFLRDFRFILVGFSL